MAFRRLSAQCLAPAITCVHARTASLAVFRAVRIQLRHVCGAPRSGDRRAVHGAATASTLREPVIVTTGDAAPDARSGTTEPATEPGPLDGVRVLDLSRVLAGPVCTMALGDMGADVIKVERPGTGDDTRAWGPPFVGDESTYFLSVNKNKRSVTIDFQTDKGRQLILDLAAKCDVLVENFTPGKLAKHGLGYDDVRAVNSKLVYCSITGFGQTGPRAQHAAYDVPIAAMGGLLSITGHADGPPAKPGVALIDVLTGMQAHGAILAALLRRGITGEGQHVDVCLLDTQVAALVNVASSALNAGVDAKRWGTAHPSIVPYQAFEFEDGAMVVSAMNDLQFKKLAAAIQRPELAHSPDFATNKARVANRETLLQILGDTFKHESRDKWLKELASAGLPVAKVNTVAEALAEPQVLARGMVQQVQHSGVGPVYVTGVPVKFSRSATDVRLPPPTLGEHTQEVLADVLGMDLDAEQLAAARKDGWL